MTDRAYGYPSAEPAEAIEVRNYRAWTQAAAAEAFAHEADGAATAGWEPQGRPIWSAPETWRLFVTPLPLLVAGYAAGLVIEDMTRGYSGYGLWGALIGGALGIGYVLLKRPLGTLTVTYVRGSAAAQEDVEDEELPRL